MKQRYKKSDNNILKNEVFLSVANNSPNNCKNSRCWARTKMKSTKKLTLQTNCQEIQCSPYKKKVPRGFTRYRNTTDEIPQELNVLRM